VERIAALYKVNQTHPAPREVIAKGLGYNSLNGASATAISALNKYGLLEGRGEDLRVSERAMHILFPQSKEEKINALRLAADEPRLFTELAERFPGGVQNDELLRNYLLRNGFAQSAVTQAIQAYRETSEFVAQESSGYDSPSQPKKEGAQMISPPTLQSEDKFHSPTVALHSAQSVDNERVLHRFDFPDGGFVEIKVSRDVDAELALQLLETSLPTVRAITAIAEKARKTVADKGATEKPRSDENKND
jgi:hypothetical protein